MHVLNVRNREQTEHMVLESASTPVFMCIYAFITVQTKDRQMKTQQQRYSDAPKHRNRIQQEVLSVMPVAFIAMLSCYANAHLIKLGYIIVFIFFYPEDFIISSFVLRHISSHFFSSSVLNGQPKNKSNNGKAAAKNMCRANGAVVCGTCRLSGQEKAHSVTHTLGNGSSSSTRE